MNYGYTTSLTANLLSFSIGTALTWSSPEVKKLEELGIFDEATKDEQGSWVSSLVSLGSVVGPFLYGYLSDTVGKKYTLLLCGLPLMICYILMAFGHTVWIFYIARFIIGLCNGGLFSVMPTYISEISAKDNRGALSSILNIYLTLGMFASYAIGPYVSVKVFNLLLAVIPAVFLIIFFIIGPESPHYYAKNNRFDDAKMVLQKLRSADVKVEDEINEMRKQIEEDGEGSISDIFKSKGLMKAFVMSVGLVAFQQFTGICAILYFAQPIFEKAGSSIDAAVCSMLIGGVMFITSFITPFVVDRLGRKMLLVASAIGMVLTEAPLGIYGILKDNGTNVDSISFLPIVCLMLFIILYNFGFGPLPWTVMGELFPANVRAAACSLTTSICWFISFLVSKYFESISAQIGMGGSFLIFSACCFCAGLFTQFFVMETKGKSLQEIQNQLNS